MTADVETVVIGGGAVGLAIGKALAEARREVMVLERHGAIGTETSARNSEVIHGGLYYAPGSLKARLCVEGRALLYRFARENGVTALKLGKLLVATTEAEIPALETIAATALKNGVGDLLRLSREEARALEPEVTCVAACLSPSTGVLDSAGYMRSLEGHIASNGGSVVLNTAVTALERLADGTFRLGSASAGETGSFTAKEVVISAGLAATDVANFLIYPSGYVPPPTIPAKGHYFALARKSPFERLVYPMPGNGGLGVHITLDVGGQAKFGPDVEWKTAIDYAFEDAGGARKTAFLREIRRYWPAVRDDDLVPAYTGIRPKISKPGEPAADFAIHGEKIHGIPGLVALYGIESPGLTSSLAIGEVVRRLLA